MTHRQDSESDSDHIAVDGLLVPMQMRTRADGGRPSGWDSDDPPELPPDYRRWDREARINYLTLGRTRVDLLAHIRGYIGSNRGSDRLDKRELAMIADDLGVIQ